MVDRHNNILGSEMEWAIMARREGSKTFLPLSSDNGMPPVTSLIDPSNLYEGISTHRSFLSNGARYYTDVGSHLEYATPENISLDDMVLSEIAGERIASDSLRCFVAGSPVVEEAILYKRVVDDHNNTWGYHVNVSEDRASIIRQAGPQYKFIDELHDALKPLIMHYATSLPMLGGGLIYDDPRIEPRYSFGQKIMDIQCDVSNSTTRDKPFINSRDEPHADNKFLRLHIVGTDPHISPWATRMMMGTTTLMLAGIKQGRVRELEYAFTTQSPGIHIGSRAKYDIEGENKYEFLKGKNIKRYRDSDIQEMYISDLEMVVGKTEDQEWALREWKLATEDRRQDVMRLRDRSDAIAKLFLIQQMNTRHGQDRNTFDSAAKGLDKAYTAVFHTTKIAAQEKSTREITATTLPAKLRRGLFAATMPSEEAIADRMVNPPSSTRAYRRAEAIRNENNLEILSLDWSRYTIIDNHVSKTTQLDPWEGKTDPING